MSDMPVYRRAQTISQVVIATAVVTFLIYWLRPVLVPFVVALFVVSGVTPILESLEKRFSISRTVASGITFIAGCLVLLVLGVSLWMSVLQMAKTGPAYRDRVSQIIDTVQTWLAESTPDMFGGGGDSNENDANEEDSEKEDTQQQDNGTPAETDSSVDQQLLPRSEITESENAGQDSTGSENTGSENTESENTGQESSDQDSIALAAPGRETGDAGGFDVGQRDGLDAAIPVPALDENAHAADETLAGLRDSMDAVLRNGLAHLSAELFSLGSTSVVVLIYVFFILLGSAEGKTSVGPLRDIDRQVRSYLFLKTIISVVTGAAFGFVLWLFGVPMSLTFGVLAFLLNYIPNVGPLVATVLPVPFILLHPEGSLMWMIGAITVTSAIQVVSGNIIEPKLMGESSDLHPVVILLALMFWGMMWGITGMFLATPITAGIKIVLERIDSTRPIANILAGRWQSWSADRTAG